MREAGGIERGKRDGPRAKFLGPLKMTYVSSGMRVIHSINMNTTVYQF